MPSTIDSAMFNKVRNFEQVTRLCVDRTNNLFDECWNIAIFVFISREISPCWVNSELLVFATAVNSCIVLINNILSLEAVRLHDECLHLLYSKFCWDNLRDAEESRLEDGVCAVTESNLLSNLRSIDIINLDIMLSKVLLNLIWDEVYKLITFEDGIQQEGTIIAKTTCYIIHVEVSLYMACHEVRRINLVSRVDWLVTKAEV